MDRILFSTLIGTFEDDNIWVIDNGASRYIIGECGKLKIISKYNSFHSIEFRANKRILY